MVKSICFATKVVLYWGLPEIFKEGNSYSVSFNGEIICETKKCYAEVNGLAPDSEYNFFVEITGENSCALGEVVCITEKEKEKIDITKPPYNAIGDGVRLNTKKFRRQ